VAPATAKGPTGRHGGLTGDGGCFAARLYTEKRVIFRGGNRDKKSREKEKWNPKRRCKKKKKDWRKWGYKRNGCAIQESGVGGYVVLCLFFFACAIPFLLLYIG
jgi:hypothetical protein